MRHLIPLVLSVAAFVAFGASYLSAQEEPGRISGVIFHDLDGDGARDDGEPSLERRIVLTRADVLVADLFTGPAGNFLFDDVLPGEYTLNATLNESSGICVDFSFTFDPLIKSYCRKADLPWHATTPDSVPVTIEGGATVQVDFGARPAHVAVLTGIALLEDDRAPPGTVIEALLNGAECGRTQARDDDELNYTIEALGANERPGCATRGDPLRFRVGGVPAATTLLWVPFAEIPLPFQVIYRDLVAIEQHAWYWFERTGENLPAEGTVVRAIIDGAVCGETEIRRPFVGIEVAGFSRLIVPSEEIQPGCGRPGATVSFLVAGIDAEISVPWEPGLQQIDLARKPGPTTLPDTGSGSTGKGQGQAIALIAALVVVGALVMGTVLLVARRR